MLADPALLRVGPLELRWSGVLLALGLALGYLATQTVATRRGVSPRVVRDAALWSLPEGLLAARVAYVLGHLDVYLVAPARVVQVWDGGFSFGAGLLVGLWALWRYSRRHALPTGHLLDAAVPGLLIGQGLAAAGRYLDLLVEPVATLPPWDQRPGSLSAPDSTIGTPVSGSSLVAAPLATALWTLALLLLYAAMARRRAAPGATFRAYLLLVALGQIAVRLVPRGGAPDTLGTVAWAAVAVAAALSALYHLRSVER